MKRRHSIQPYLLMLVFIGPILLAGGAYYGSWDWTRRGGAAHGDLVDPPRPFPAGALTTASGTRAPDDWLLYRWSLIYARTAPCDATCVEQLNRVNQVRLALGKEMGRAQVVMLFAGAVPALPDGAEVTLARLDDGPGRRMLDFLREPEIRNGRIYVTDPRGRLVITYPPDVEREWLLEDLERLLQIG